MTRYTADLPKTTMRLRERNGYITEATGAGKWLIGKHLAVLKAYVKKNNGGLFKQEKDGRNLIII